MTPPDDRTRSTPHDAFEARRLAPAASAAPEGEFSYVVLADPPASTGGERRGAARRRTRLRSGKIVGEDGRFMTECLIHDLSPTGGRLRLPPGQAVPRTMRIYDDQTGMLHEAVVLWQRDRDIGVRLQPVRDQRSRRIADDMRRKYYAVRD